MRSVHDEAWHRRTNRSLSAVFYLWFAFFFSDFSSVVFAELLVPRHLVFSCFWVRFRHFWPLFTQNRKSQSQLSQGGARPSCRDASTSTYAPARNSQLMYRPPSPRPARSPQPTACGSITREVAVNSSSVVACQCVCAWGGRGIVCCSHVVSQKNGWLTFSNTHVIHILKSNAVSSFGLFSRATFSLPGFWAAISGAISLTLLHSHLRMIALHIFSIDIT